MSAFWTGYTSEVRFRSADDLEQRGLRHLGVCLLARVDGTSPVDYLTDNTQREKVRRLARAILLDEVDTWADFWQRCAHS